MSDHRSLSACRETTTLLPNTCDALDLVEALSAALDAKNRYTCGHSNRVADLSSALARTLGKDEDSIERIHIAGNLHDIGKIGVPDAIITKPGPLTAEETALMRRHPIIGEELIGHISALQPLRSIIRHHHEFWNGKGYPDGLSGTDIPLEARIIGVADAYDSMTSNRSYRVRMAPHAAAAEILHGSGRQFDPFIVEAFLHLFEDRIIRRPSFKAALLS